MPDLLNRETKFVSLDSAICKPAIVSGWDSIRRGEPFDYELADSGWGYEYGRQFAIICQRAFGRLFPLRPNINLVRPLWIAHRLEQTICGIVHPSMTSLYADSTTGKFSPERYAARFYNGTASSSASSSSSSPLGF